MERGEFTRPKERQTVPPDIDQFWALLDLAAGHRLYPLMLLAGNAGLRRGELAGLRWEDINLDRWEDINLDAGQVTVNRQHKSIKYRVGGVGGQVRGRSAAHGDARGHTLTCLKRWRETQDTEREAWGEAYRDEGLVFTWQYGRPYHPDYLSATVRRLMRLAGIIDARLRNLRHFLAAVVISAGYDIEAVSKALGHSSVQITSKIYSATGPVPS